MPHFVSRKYLSSDFASPPTLDEKVTVFEDRVLGWQIDIAQEVRRQIESGGDNGPFRHAGYALVSLLFSYFEMIAQFIEGTSSQGGSKATFVRGFKYVYPSTTMSNSNIEEVYKRVRCGMYHDGFTVFLPILSHDNRKFYPFALNSNGTVAVQMRWLKVHPPFDTEEGREQLHQKLSQFDGFLLGEKGMLGIPKVPIASITDSNKCADFTTTLDWIVSELRQHAQVQTRRDEF